MAEPEFSDAVSMTDQTGAVPSAPQNEGELESYMEIINFSADSANVFMNGESK